MAACCSASGTPKRRWTSAALAGLAPAGVICEILDDDGHAMRRDALDRFAATHGLTFITVAQLVAHRLTTERLVHRVAEARLPTDIGSATGGSSATATTSTTTSTSRSSTATSARREACSCACTPSASRATCSTRGAATAAGSSHKAMEAIVAEGRGVIVYLDQEGRGIGLLNKLKAYELQDAGHDTVEANEKLGFEPDLRNYGIGAQILLDLGVRRIRVLTNNPKKLVGLEGYGLEIVDRVHLAAPTTDENAGYLDAKRDKLGHLLST